MNTFNNFPYIQIDRKISSNFQMPLSQGRGVSGKGWGGFRVRVDERESLLVLSYECLELTKKNHTIQYYCHKQASIPYEDHLYNMESLLTISGFI